MTTLDFPKMTPALRAYLDFNPERDEGGWDEAFRLRDLVEPGLNREYQRMEINADFTPEHERPETCSEELSPSGAYKLVTVDYKSGKGFGRVQGRVYRQGSDEPIALVNRNYGSFPFLFVEDHPNGHAYLIAGEDYQGQTVVELDTGRRLDFLPPDADKGFGFCWSSYEFDRASQLLVVCGCIWACPYEFRFYDFSDPMAGWPELEVNDLIDSDRKAPVIEPDGTILCFQSEGEDDEDRKVVATKVLRREGPKLVLVREDMSPEEAERRARAKAAQEADDAWWETYKTTDPLYLRSLELLNNPRFTPEKHCGIGQTYKDWCPHWHGEERRICRRIHRENKPYTGYTFDLEIAHLTGPVKLQIFKESKSVPAVFFEHSVAGVEQAVAHALALLEGGA
jgi:hypothetical protein